MKCLKPGLTSLLVAAALLAASPVVRAQGTPAQSDAGQPLSLEKRVENLESPIAIKFKGLTITPMGFLDLTGVYRSTNNGGSIGTGFGSIPFSNVPAGQLSESRISAQNSRLALKIDGAFGQTKVTAMFEGDFLGNQPTNANVTSNSQTFRMRIYFADTRTGPLEVLAGQDWSLMTPNRVGISPYTWDVFYSQAVDTNYLAGLVWTRAAQFRVVLHPSEQLAFAVALENPDQYIGGSVVLPSTLAASYGTQFDNGSTATSPNVFPDVLAKVAYDTPDHTFHIEAAGVYRSFKAYDTLTAQSNTASGAGGSVNLSVNVAKGFRLLANTFYSDGGGRYIGTGLAPDLIARPDGSLSAVRSLSGVVGFEASLSKTTNLFGYYSGMTAYSNVSLVGTTFSGFGFPGSANANRTVQEGTIGFNQAFWKNPSYGSFALLGQYSYLTRLPWAVAAGTPQRANANIVYLDVRYTLP